MDLLVQGVTVQVFCMDLDGFWSRTGFMYDLIGDIEDMILGGIISTIETNLATLPVPCMPL